MKKPSEIYNYLMTLYTIKETQAVVAFYGDIEHLKLLNGDLITFLERNGEDFTKFNTDQRIEAEFRISMLFSFFHVCLEYKTRTAFSSGIKKQHPELEKYLTSFDETTYSNLRIYRNKTFHENSSLFEDWKEKKKLNPKENFNKIYSEMKSFFKAAGITTYPANE
ncbi:MAG: hypothetical protein HOP07_13200 [Bacteriovoracaceae bacterium]|nr:hypothetical protein [Bacteriovoracaceae bacterium]